MSDQEDKDMKKPSPSRQSDVFKEPYAYTPSWMSPAERSRLKARIMKIKQKEGRWGVKKEEGTLVQKSPSPSPTREPKQGATSPPQPPLEDMTVIKEEEPDVALKGHPSAISKEPSLTANATSTPKKLPDDTKKSKKSSKDSKESVSKKKSKEELAMAKKAQKAKHPKAPHANPSGNRVEDEEPWIPHPRDTIEAHLWATDFRHFDPQLYAFKTPEKLSTKKPVVAECPPFWVLNDHTIAVAWKLYCKEADRSDLGIVALQWSREFVSAMKDERGEYPNAIKHLLDAIEDGLIFRYSRAAEDSKKAHQKDDISYASSDSVFKPPTEVSYTLKDIMSRNFPGRKFVDDHEASTTIRKDDTNASVVSKTFISVPEDETVTQKDLIALLKQYKIEQQARIKHEMNTSKEIERLLKQAEDGKLPVAIGERRRHLDFDVPGGSEPMLTASKKKTKNEADLKKTASAASNKSTKSDVSGKSAASDKSEKSAKSRGSISSAGSNYDTISDQSMAEFDAKSEAKAMKKKRSKDNAARKQSKESVGRKKSKESVGRKKSKDSLGRKKSKDSVGRKQSKDSVASRKSSKGENKAKKGSKGSGEKKGSKGSR